MGRITQEEAVKKLINECEINKVISFFSKIKTQNVKDQKKEEE